MHQPNKVYWFYKKNQNKNRFEKEINELLDDEMLRSPVRDFYGISDEKWAS